MALRFATLAAALAVAAPAAAQTGKPNPEADRTVIEAEIIEGVSDLEVGARGNAEIRRDDMTIFGETLRYNREFGRAEGDGGVRLQRGADRFFGPRLLLQHARRHRRVREPDLSPRAGAHCARQRRAHRVPRARPLPSDERDLHHLPPGAGGLAARGARARARLRGRGRHGALAAAALLRHHDPCLAVGRVPARRPPQERPAHALLCADQHARPRVRHSVLLEHRAGARRHAYAGVHAKARRPAEERAALPRAPLRRRAALRVPARRPRVRRFARGRVLAAQPQLPAH